MKFLSILLLTGLLFVGRAAADPAVEFSFEVFQHDAQDNRDVLLFADTNQILPNLTTTGFMISFSIEIEVTEIDSNQTAFSVYIVGLGPNAYNNSRNFTVEYGLPAYMRDIEGKNDSKYTLKLVPIRQSDYNRALCDFNHRDRSDFEFLPTAHTDIYYVKNSLGDFYFDAAKELFETQYRTYKQLFNFNLPGKYTIYLCPCPIPSVIWDKRFGMALDPTRSTAWAVYTIAANSADPFLLNTTAMYRNLGYAPPLIAEGLGNFLSVAAYDMKAVLDSSKAPPLDEMIDTYQYYQADPIIADRTAASFVRYLLASFDRSQFMQLYAESDNLNLGDKLTEIYGLSIPELELEWQTYVDTMTITASDLSYQAYLAEMSFNYPAMLHYALASAERSSGYNDSIRTLGTLERAYFFNGDYYQATEVQAAQTKMDPSNALNWMTEASYKMMNGYYDSALSDLRTGLSLDSTNQMLRFNLGVYYLYNDRPDSALAQFRDIITNGSDQDAQGESRVMAGFLLLKKGDKKDHDEAERYFNEARSIYAQILNMNNASPSAQMWYGMCMVGLGIYGDAIDYLNTALFLESRPFYVGMIYLWLGKAHDLHGERELARDYYGKVLALPSADYHQKEARRYLDQPFTL